ncbi:MAG TPA: hybrid sensor histidine kinase/response regulator [Bacteroidales bacterium]|nr:hybrid sensor histidine kinase/response regulator [Bacteroidales bacterium]
MKPGKKVILCVDDERMVLTSLKAQLKRGLGPDYVIETAESGEEALEIIDDIQTEGADLPLVISDQIMPGCKGDDLLIIIQKRLPRSLSIMLTGHATAEAIGRALNYGKLYRYIAKPWEEVDLILTVSEAVRSYYQAQTIEEQQVELSRLVSQLREYNESLEQRVKERTLEIEIKNKEIEKQRDTLEEINAVKDKLFAIIGHDLKNSLTALMSISSSINNYHDEMTDEDKHEGIRKISQASQEMNRLLEHLLDWALIQNGKVQLRRSAFNLNHLAGETIDVMKYLAEKKKITINHTIPTGYQITADRNMIGTVLRNLLSNAIKFSPEGGIVDITAQPEPHGNGYPMYIISVEDKGVGMTHEQLSSLFRIGHTVSSTGTANEKGTGLGLLICKDLVEMNGGSINALSSPGQGSRFAFTVPAN